MHKVLVLDDSVDILDATDMLLTKKGYLVKTAIDRQEFFLLYHTFQPDVVIIDILLQDIDGREICAELRTDPKNAAVCILMFSASPNMLHDFKSYGANDCMEKPFEIKSLLLAIENCLANHK